MATVKFTAMKDGDREDYEFLTAHEIDYAAKTGDRLLDALVQLDEGPVGLQDHAARPFAAGGDARLARRRRHRLDRLRAAARHRRHLRALQSRRICRGDPEAVRARAMHLGGGKARRFPAALLRASSRRQPPRAGPVRRPSPISTIATSSASAGTSRASIPDYDTLPIDILPAVRARGLRPQGLRPDGHPRRRARAR